jgi:Beta-lactamase associated winged helix domain
MYKGLDPRLHGAAGRSVLAHLVDLEQRGRAKGDGPTWSLNAE